MGYLVWEESLEYVRKCKSEMMIVSLSMFSTFGERLVVSSVRRV